MYQVERGTQRIAQQPPGGRAHVRQAHEHAARIHRDYAREVLTGGGQVVVAELSMNGTEAAAARLEERAVPAYASGYDRLVGRHPGCRLEEGRAGVLRPQSR